MISLMLAALLAQDAQAARYTPAEAQALFDEAREAYGKQDFAGAQARYEQLIKAGMGGPTVLYNLGTTHLAANQLGPAVLYLERAHALAHDEDTEANLAVARQKQGDQVVGEDTAEPFLQRLASAMNVQVVGWSFLITWYLGFLLAVLAWRRASMRWWFGLAAAVLLLVGTVLGAAVGIHAYVSRTVIEAVVISETVKARELPGERARVAFEVHAGLKVRVMEQTGRYVRIRLPNALEGWTEKEGLVEL